MNSAVSFFVGAVTFVLVMILKMPVKRITWWLAKHCRTEERSRYVFYKRCNSVLFILTAVVAVYSYYVLYRLIALDHFKWCCTLKAAAIAMAIYAVYELWFGSDYENWKDNDLI